MKLRLVILAAICAAVLAVPAGARADAGPVYYVALGDSLATGAQPARSGELNGLHAANGTNRGWLEGFPPVLARRLGWVAAAGVAALMTVLLYLVLARGKDQALAMGADLPTVLFALLDGVIAVTGTLWFLFWLRRRWPAHGVMLGKAARASYATYVIHPLVLTAVMVALAPVALAPEIKLVLVAAAGVAARFTAGYALTRVPGIAKVL